MTFIESDTADMRNINDARRPVNSNIGVRRLPLSSQTQCVITTSRPQGLDEGNKYSAIASRDRRLLELDQRKVRRSDRVRKHDRINGTDPVLCVEPISPGIPALRAAIDKGTARYDDTVLDIQEDQASRDSSDTDSPTTILINPNVDMLPVTKTRQARASFDFYVNSYVTSIIEVSPRDIDKYSHVVHQILHDEMLFTSFTTCSEAARWRTQSLHADAPLSVVKGYGKTISLLSHRLRSGKFAMSPTILLTMGQLVAIETLTKNVSATAKHLAGMQSVIAGNKSTKSSSDSSPVQNAVDVWGTYFAYRANTKATINREASLTYPGHPFPPDVTRQISELPIGFADTALSGRLSTEMLTLLERFNNYFADINRLIEEGITDSEERTHVVLQQAARCIEYAQIQTLSVIERLILAGLTAYVVRKDRIHPGLINIRGYYQITCANLLNLLTVKPLPRPRQDVHLLNWIGLILLLTSSTEAYARKLALKILPNKPEPMKIVKQCEEFFWDNDLTNALLSGSVLVTHTSNDIIAENVKQALPEADT